MQPAEWCVEDDRLKVFDESHAPIREKHFPEGLNEDAYVFPSGRPSYRKVIVDDLDNDGDREVLFAGAGLGGQNRGPHVFNRDGATRFVHLPAPAVHFGATPYEPYWTAFNVFVTRDARGTPSIWPVFIHGAWFPTLVQQIDPRGTVRSEYWSNGYVHFVGSDTWRGRPVMLVGGTDNEHKGASLAIFDGSRVQGSAPAVKAEYTCTDCQPGHPLAFVVFPRTCVLARLDGQPFVDKAWIDSRDRIVVMVGQGDTTVAGQHQRAMVYYTLGPDLTPEQVELTREYGLGHTALERQGKLDHALGPADEKDFFPLLRWDGDRFTPLAAAVVRR
jgi:hypothetical protein